MDQVMAQTTGGSRLAFAPRMNTMNTQASRDQGIEGHAAKFVDFRDPRDRAIASIAFVPSTALAMESCAVHHYSPVYLAVVRYGDIDEQAFIGPAIKVTEVAQQVDQGYLVTDVYMMNTKTCSVANQIVVPDSCIRAVLKRRWVGETLATLPRR
jgi:hypothetical protein